MLNNTNKVMFIISENFNNDNVCEAMVSMARSKYLMSERLIPVLTSDVPMPTVLNDLRMLDFTGLTNPYEKLYAALLEPVTPAHRAPVDEANPLSHDDEEGMVATESDNPRGLDDLSSSETASWSAQVDDYEAGVSLPTD